MRYVPNPAHKLETSESGPPKWYPDKEPCPMSPRVKRFVLSYILMEENVVSDIPDVLEKAGLAVI